MIINIFLSKYLIFCQTSNEGICTQKLNTDVLDIKSPFQWGIIESSLPFEKKKYEMTPLLNRKFSTLKKNLSFFFFFWMLLQPVIPDDTF